MLQKFDKSTEAGRKRLDEALSAQAICQGLEAEVRGRVLDLVILQEHKKGDVIIEQGHTSDDVFLILSGAAEVIIDKRQIALRKLGQHVGEMSAIEPSAPRCACVRAERETVTAKISADALCVLADKHPRIWRNLSKVLAARLRERPVRPRNERSQVFIGSAAEDLAVVNVLMQRFDHTAFDPRPWTIGVFQPSGVTMDDLLSQADRSDFAVLVLGATDKTISRRKQKLSPRDNVILEYGLFAGALGRRERVFLVAPRGVDLKLPSDLLGLKILTYETARALDIALAQPAIEISEAVAKLGPR